jgi:hypothetical protein
MSNLCGPVRRWKEGKILYAENDIILAAYVVSRDKRKIGTVGWYGEPSIWVEFISPEHAKSWGGSVEQKAVEK